MLGDIFQRNDGHERQAYRFEMPGVLIGGDDIAVDFHAGQWHLTQRRNHAPDGPPWVASGDTLWTAVLSLIALRMGFRASFEEIPDSTEEEISEEFRASLGVVMAENDELLRRLAKGPDSTEEGRSDG